MKDSDGSKQELERVAKVGLSVAIMNGKDQVLMGKRISSLGEVYGDGKWQFCGGKLTHGEDWIKALKREVKEETDLDVYGIQFLTAKNCIFKEIDLHYVCCFFLAHTEAEPKVMESDKCSEWKWFDVDNIPESHETFWDLKLIIEENEKVISAYRLKFKTIAQQIAQIANDPDLVLRT